MPTGSHKDAACALKRQAVRFRIHGYNAADEPVAEPTADNADLRWTVHVANSKAAWYQFRMALDIRRRFGSNTADGGTLPVGAVVWWVRRWSRVSGSRDRRCRDAVRAEW